ncbi:ABC-type spermidine/putrescine transport system permease subunit I [Rhodobacter aestuarii]|uniref:Spermidine/putrescine transport system permease protein n=1 Tax=Rhodobacter aestuarii TaxID=453582 RepID=A0A1N7MBE3_9RHOB|nr:MULTISPECIES: ABC transporter permease [Rhodobacter]PTV94967.1 ABC-type spermidine/putrescine transport system permease subunit I [Rhodobacter aestuarii]SIS83301.1 spermidine/putrescine transport system permease protein [Rhodobacter aestuarii]SOB97800.1 ABC-type spermidine/putrescine transport system permease subunit I [Rhodobacter sp. JA431]
MSASPLRRLARSETANGYLMVSPTLIYAVLLLAAPLVIIFAYSFFKDGYLEVIHEFTTANYIEAWSDPIFRAILLRSVTVSAIVTFVTVVLAFPIAYFISFNVPAANKSRWLFLITIPFWTSYLIRVFQWKVILGYNGVINSVLMGLGITDDPLQMLNTIGAIAITLAHAYAPFAILPIFVSLEKIDRSLLEAGQDLGESRLMTFWRVTLPLAMPGVIGAVMIVFIPTIGDYVTPVIIGGGKLPMVANMIQMDMLKIDNKPLGSAIAVSSMFVVAAISLIFLFLNRRFLRGPK